MLRTAGEAESTTGHGGRRTGAGRPRYMALDWENRHVRVRLERPLHQAWVKLRESGGFQDDSSFSSGAPGRCRPGPGLGAGAGCGTGSSFSYITAVLGSIRNTQCACATRWIVPLKRPPSFLGQKISYNSKSCFILLVSMTNELSLSFFFVYNS